MQTFKFSPRQCPITPIYMHIFPIYRGTTSPVVKPLLASPEVDSAVLFGKDRCFRSMSFIPLVPSSWTACIPRLLVLLRLISIFVPKFPIKVPEGVEFYSTGCDQLSASSGETLIADLIGIWDNFI